MIRSAFIGMAAGSGGLMLFVGSLMLHECLIVAGYAVGEAALLIFTAWFAIGIVGAFISKALGK